MTELVLIRIITAPSPITQEHTISFHGEVSGWEEKDERSQTPQNRFPAEQLIIKLLCGPDIISTPACSTHGLHQMSSRKK